MITLLTAETAALTLEANIEQLIRDVVVHGFTVRSSFQILADCLSDEQADYVMDEACARSEAFRDSALAESYSVPGAQHG